MCWVVWTCRILTRGQGLASVHDVMQVCFCPIAMGLKCRFHCYGLEMLVPLLWTWNVDQNFSKKRTCVVIDRKFGWHLRVCGQWQSRCGERAQRRRPGPSESTYTADSTRTRGLVRCLRVVRCVGQQSCLCHGCFSAVPNVHDATIISQNMDSRSSNSWRLDNSESVSQSIACFIYEVDHQRFVNEIKPIDDEDFESNKQLFFKKSITHSIESCLVCFVVLKCVISFVSYFHQDKKSNNLNLIFLVDQSSKFFFLLPMLSMYLNGVFYFHDSLVLRNLWFWILWIFRFDCCENMCVLRILWKNIVLLFSCSHLCSICFNLETNTTTHGAEDSRGLSSDLSLDPEFCN